MFQKTKKHMPGDRRSVAEEFYLTYENGFAPPTLEQIYWSDPNVQRGTIVRCTNAEMHVADTPRLYDTSPVKVEVHTSEGI